jgi:hypothetical protein
MMIITGRQSMIACFFIHANKKIRIAAETEPYLVFAAAKPLSCGLFVLL